MEGRYTTQMPNELTTKRSIYNSELQSCAKVTIKVTTDVRNRWLIGVNKGMSAECHHS